MFVCKLCPRGCGVKRGDEAAGDFPDSDKGIGYNFFDILVMSGQQAAAYFFDQAAVLGYQSV